MASGALCGAPPEFLSRTLRIFEHARVQITAQKPPSMLGYNKKGRFEYFVFGGILGDKPAKRRTESIINELKQNKIKFEERNLGTVRMPTDNAVYAAKKILDGAELSDLKFIDEVEFEINENESVQLPFRYIVDDDKLAISEELVEHLRKRKGF